MPAPQLHKRPIVALVGRTNVGKSTLWNKLTETGAAIVSPEPNTTRDRNEAPVIWRGLAIDVVDTGGMDTGGDEIQVGIVAQAKEAIRTADLVLFMVDAKSGIMPQDKELAKQVKSLHKHILFVANKTDDLRHLGGAFSKESFGLGFGEAIPCSASTGRGVGDLLDHIYDELMKLGKSPQPVPDPEGLKLVVMGRTNVGKSSLVNAILGEDRLITSPIAHTTREPIDTQLEWKGEPVTLIDTAGMRKRARIDTRVDEESLDRNKRALFRADIAILVLDATEPPTTQDKKLAGLMKEETKGLIIVANKWDLVQDKTTHTTEEFERVLRYLLPFLQWAPIIFTSAKKSQRTDAILDLAFKIREERRRVISYNALQKFLKTVVARKKPLAEVGSHSPYLYDVKQVGIEPPSFLITVRGQKESVHQSWVKYFEKQLRDKFGFHGTPIVVKVQLVQAAKLETQEGDTRRSGPNRRKRPIGRKGGRY